jgi:hypothetical protein
MPVALSPGMFFIAPLAVFALQAPCASTDVAEALADADQIVRVHEAPGAIVFDLDRAGELFQLSVSIDDDGRVQTSAIDWVGPTGDVTGVATNMFAHVHAVEAIDVDAARHIVIRGDGRLLTLALTAKS